MDCPSHNFDRHIRLDVTGAMHGAGGAPATLPAVLDRRAAEAPDRLSLTFLQDGETETGHLTQGALARAAGRIATALARRGVDAGARVLLLYPSGLDFAQAFFGTLRAGAVAVPAPHAQGGRAAAARLAAIARDAAPALVLTPAGLCAATSEALGNAIPVATIDTLLAEAAIPDTLPWPAPDDLALIQYTSGSTGNPRGVMITHAAISANQRLITERFGHTPETVCVSWLPMFHDMGLIGNLLQPVHAGYHAVLMPPVAFLEEPRRWLAAITRYGTRDTITAGVTAGAPNFAYDFCVDRIALADRAGLDLRGWDIAYSGSEPVRAATLDRFATAFAPYGFRRRAFYPCYGMAEATLLIAGGDKAKLPPRATLDAPDQAPRAVVGCGVVGTDHAVLIVDPDTRTPLPDGTVGEIWFAGPSVAAGYWQRPAETAASFGASPADRDDPRWLCTGDLGFVQGGEVFVTGRIKDVLIVKGRNHYPQDLEATVQASHPGLRPDCGAAFLVEGADRDARDRQALVIVHEVTAAVLRAPPVADIMADIAGAARAAISRDHGLHLAVVALIRPGSLPKTTSGKLQRSRTRAAFLAGDLPLLAEDRHGPAFWKQTLIQPEPAHFPEPRIG